MDQVHLIKCSLRGKVAKFNTQYSPFMHIFDKICYAMVHVCDFNDMLYDFYAMLWFVCYAIKH